MARNPYNLDPTEWAATFFLFAAGLALLVITFAAGLVFLYRAAFACSP